MVTLYTKGYIGISRDPLDTGGFLRQQKWRRQKYSIEAWSWESPRALGSAESGKAPFVSLPCQLASWEFVKYAAECSWQSPHVHSWAQIIRRQVATPSEPQLQKSQDRKKDPQNTRDQDYDW